MKSFNTSRLIQVCLFLMVFTLSLSRAVAQDRTATGFYYPTGTSTPPGTDGTWLATGCDTYFPGMYHLGYDLIKPRGNPVYAISNGTNVDIYTSSNPDVSFIWIKHQVRNASGNPLTVWAVYGHITARPGLGATVNAGEVIGYIMPYDKTVDHCHFGINTVGIVFKQSDFTMNYINASNQTLRATATIGWGLGNFSGSMPSGWCSHPSENRVSLEKLGYVDPLAFIRQYRPAESTVSENIYVDGGSNGNDSNSGTSGSPFNTLKKALEQVSLGTPKTIYCQPGYTYFALNGRVPPRCTIRRWGGSGNVIIKKL